MYRVICTSTRVGQEARHSETNTELAAAVLESDADFKKILTLVPGKKGEMSTH